MYSYCIYELRFSEDEAFRRVSAARLVRRFPALLDAVAAGELHLTGLLMLGPHLTHENLGEVLARAKHRTKKEIARLVRVLDPLPAVPARIEPLGSAPARLVPKTPTWAEFMQSFCPVRELSVGERPRDWVEPVSDCANDAEGARAAASALTSMPELLPEGVPGVSHEPPNQTAAARLEPERYGIHFTANEEYVTLVGEAQALLSHSAPRISLYERHLRAMRALVAELKRKRYPLPAPARKRDEPTGGATAQRATKTPQPRGRGNETREPVERWQSARTKRAHPRRRGNQTSHPPQRWHSARTTTPNASQRAAPSATSTRAGATSTVNTAATFPRPSGAASTSATARAALLRTSLGGAAAKLIGWSCTTSIRLRRAASTRPTISRCTVEPTTLSPLSRTSAAASCNTTGAPRTTNAGTNRPGALEGFFRDRWVEFARELARELA